MSITNDRAPKQGNIHDEEKADEQVNRRRIIDACREMNRLGINQGT